MSRIWLEKLADIERSGDKILKDDGGGNIIEVIFLLNKKTNARDIKKLEKKIGFNLPEPLCAFLLTYNGGDLYNYDDLDGYRFFNTKQIASITKANSNDYGDDWNENIVLIAECIGEGNYIGLRYNENKKTYNVIDCYHESNPCDWDIIDKDLDDFFNKLIANNGDKYWL